MIGNLEPFRQIERVPRDVVGLLLVARFDAGDARDLG